MQSFSNRKQVSALLFNLVDSVDALFNLGYFTAEEGARLDNIIFKYHGDVKPTRAELESSLNTTLKHLAEQDATSVDFESFSGSVKSDSGSSVSASIIAIPSLVESIQKAVRPTSLRVDSQTILDSFVIKSKTKPAEVKVEVPSVIITEQSEVATIVDHAAAPSTILETIVEEIKEDSITEIDVPTTVLPESATEQNVEEVNEGSKGDTELKIIVPIAITTPDNETVKEEFEPKATLPVIVTVSDDEEIKEGSESKYDISVPITSLDDENVKEELELKVTLPGNEMVEAQVEPKITFPVTATTPDIEKSNKNKEECKQGSEKKADVVLPITTTTSNVEKVKNESIAPITPSSPSRARTPIKFVQSIGSPIFESTPLIIESTKVEVADKAEVAKNAEVSTEPKKLKKYFGKTIFYEEGDILGKSATPLDPSSKGHAMLMKMGWKARNGLGSDGTGVRTLVEQKVKTSKGGLGADFKTLSPATQAAIQAESALRIANAARAAKGLPEIKPAWNTVIELDLPKFKQQPNPVKQQPMPAKEQSKPPKQGAKPDEKSSWDTYTPMTPEALDKFLKENTTGRTLKREGSVSPRRSPVKVEVSECAVSV